MKRALALQFPPAAFTSVQVRFQQLFLVERELAIQKQRNAFSYFFTRHTNSPNAARIF